MSEFFWRDSAPVEFLKEQTMAKKAKEAKEPHMTQIYCDNSECPAREIEVFTKDHLYRKTAPNPRNWHCPICGGPVTVHWRSNLNEHQKCTLQGAIGNVNAAPYQREHDDPGIPASVLCLDTLPDGWKCVEHPQEALTEKA